MFWTVGLVCDALCAPLFGFFSAVAHDGRVDEEFPERGVVRRDAEGEEVFAEEGGQDPADFVAEGGGDGFGGGIGHPVAWGWLVAVWIWYAEEFRLTLGCKCASCDAVRDVSKAGVEIEDFRRGCL